MYSMKVMLAVDVSAEQRAAPPEVRLRSERSFMPTAYSPYSSVLC